MDAASRVSSVRPTASGGDAEVPQHRVDARGTAPEGLEAVERIAAAADLEDLLPVAPAGVEIEDAGFLEGAEGICRQHFGPRITVVARRVAAAENV